FSLHTPATADSSPLSLHDALPIWREHGRDSTHAALAGARPLLGLAGLANREDDVLGQLRKGDHVRDLGVERLGEDAGAVAGAEQDRKSTRLNSSHQIISYAVFCLK